MEKGSKYLAAIKKALSILYDIDKDLFEDRGGSEPHEQTFSFRIALYLQNLLREEENLFIDCEYHGAYGEKGNRKKVFITDGEKENRKEVGDSSETSRRVRPDIIYHDRKEKNIFCIEVKRKLLAKKDSENVIQYRKKYKYEEGFCIYNLRKNSVHVKIFTDCHQEGKVYKYKWDNRSKEFHIKKGEGS